MIIGRIIRFWVVLIILSGCMPMDKEPSFEVFGDQALLDRMVINVEAYRNNEPPYLSSNLQTLLYKGQQYTVSHDHGVGFYKFYISVDDAIVRVITTDNVMMHFADQINELHIEALENGQVSMTYYGALSEKRENRQTLRKYVIHESIDDAVKRMTAAGEEDALKKLMTFYDPRFAKEVLLPLRENRIQYYKSLSFEERKQHYLMPSDLARVGLKDEEIAD